MSPCIVPSPRAAVLFVSCAWEFPGRVRHDNTGVTGPTESPDA